MRKLLINLVMLILAFTIQICVFPQIAFLSSAPNLLLIVVLLLVIAYTIHNARVEKEKMLSNLLTVYGQNLENRIQIHSQAL